jgi:hypothetical protein
MFTETVVAMALIGHVAAAWALPIIALQSSMPPTLGN